MSNIVLADYSFTHPSVAQLKSQEISAVGRYFGQDTTKDGKNLTRSEAILLSQNDIEIFSLFEYQAGQAEGGAAAARRDVTVAREQRAETLMPFGRPWYYSYDKDLQDYAPSLPDTPENAMKKLGPVGEYYTYIKQQQGLAHSGAYGGYYLIKRLFDADLIAFGMQTVAWSGGQWEPRACLRQTGATSLGGAVDLDTPERSDFGQWRVGTQTIRKGILVPQSPVGPAVSLTSTDGKTWM